MSLYDNVKAACIEKGISISELERELEMSRGYISKWNKNIPSIEKVAKVAERLDKPLEYFVKGE